MGRASHRKWVRRMAHWSVAQGRFRQHFEVLYGGHRLFVREVSHFLNAIHMTLPEFRKTSRVSPKSAVPKLRPQMGGR